MTVSTRRERVTPLTFRRFLVICMILLLFLTVAVGASAQDDATVQAGMTSDGIPTLVDSQGFTLYTFAHDHEGESTCYDRCAEEWPPLTLESGAEPTAGENVPGELGTVEREDGSMQVTYMGFPLYYYHEDEAPGDANGQGVADVWFAANTATVMVSEHPGFGQILVGPGGMTLYYFTEDEIEDDVGESYCYEECAVAWPPLIVPEGMQPLAAADLPGELALTPGTDGTQQVTYNGWPLYFFKGDMMPGDVNGSALKGVWWVAQPEQQSETVSIGLHLVAEGLTSPVAFVSSGDGTGRWFIADQAGVIRILTADGQLLEEPFLDLTQQIIPLRESYDERGVLGLAFHPDYANNGRFYVYYTAPLRAEAPEGWDHTNIVGEFTVSPDNPDLADLGTQRIIWSIDQPQFNHDAGQIAFGPDGYLYVPIGDGGGANDTGMGHAPETGNAQDTSNLHGNILRIDVNGEFPYTIPPDNPFVGADDGIADEIFAYGLRNPWRIAFDMGGERQLFVSDAGQDLFEEINIVTAGGNYGWNIKEGTHWFDPENPAQPSADCPSSGANGQPLIDPIIEYDHHLGIVAVGGMVYRGSALPELSGQYIFGDYAKTQNSNTGSLFAAAPPTEEGALWQMTELQVANNESGLIDAYILSFGQDENGEVYVLTTENGGPSGDTGKVWRIVPASEADAMETTSEPETTPEAPADTSEETAPETEGEPAPGTEEEPPPPQETPETSG